MDQRQSSGEPETSAHPCAHHDLPQRQAVLLVLDTATIELVAAAHPAIMTPMDLTNQFLIAMPSLADPNFHRTVTLMCAHSEDGAMGIVINRPLDIKLTAVLDHMSIELTSNDAEQIPVLQGGPVQRERGFVIHHPPGDWDAVLRVGDDIGISTSKDILSAVAEGRGPERVIIALGYAGWGAGQLEHEVQQNAWLSGPADSRIIFDTPYEERWTSAARLLGIDPDHLSGDAGHA